MRLAPSNSPDQFQKILEALAQVQGMPALTAEKLLGREARQLNWETTMVVITAVPTESLINTLGHFQRTGRRVAMVVIDSGASLADFGNIPVYHISKDVYRKQLESLRLESK